VIAELAAETGAYIIISSSGSTADSALKNRRAAMAEAVKDIADAAKLHLDFYDRNRIASWVRDHAGLIPWVRSRIGKSVPGWRSYGACRTPRPTRTRAISWMRRPGLRRGTRTMATVFQPWTASTAFGTLYAFLGRLSGWSAFRASAKHGW